VERMAAGGRCLRVRAPLASPLTEIDPALLRKVDPLAGKGLEQDFLSK
jgi:hypothetical protein